MFKQKSKTPTYIRRVILLVLPLVVLATGFGAVLSNRQQALAATNSTMNFQARLLTAAGSVVPDGTYNIEFKIYNAASSSGSSQGSCSGDIACVWTETRTVSNKVKVRNGYLTVNLGSVTAFSTAINWDQELWLTMNIGGTGSPAWDGEMDPRLKLTSVPYAFRAGALVSSDGLSVVTANEAGTICVQNSANCGFVQGSSTDYIQNQAGDDQTSNFRINGTGKATAFHAGSFDTATAEELFIGNENATAINMSQDTFLADGKTLTVTGGATSLTGAATGDALTVSNDGSTGNIMVLKDGSTTVATVGDGGTATFQNSANSSNAFRVLNQGGEELIGLNTTDSVLRLLSNSTGHLSSFAPTSTITATEGAGYITANGYAYIIGGCNGSGANTATVQYARIKADGTLGTWSTTTALPTGSANYSNCNGAAATYNGYIYVTGGTNAVGTANDVLMARINNDGTISAWTKLTSEMPSDLKSHSMFTYNGYLYVVGGFTISGATTPARDVSRARINADGTLGAFTSQTNWLPAGRGSFGLGVANGFVYVVGGKATNGGQGQNSLYYGRINNDGSLAAAVTNTAPGFSVRAHNTVVLNGYIYAMGGGTSAYTSDIRYAPLNNDGGVGTWTLDTTTFPSGVVRGSGAAMTANGYVYYIGGTTGSAVQDTVYYASGSRVKVGGALDLVGLSGENLAEGGSGGQLTAGNTHIVGTLTTTGNANFRDGALINNNLNVTGMTTLQATSGATNALQILNAAGNSLLNVGNIGSVNLLTAGGDFEGSTNGWVLRGSGSISSTTAQSYLHSSSLSIVTTAASKNGARYDTSLSAVPYTLSFYAKLASGTGTFNTLIAGYANEGTALGQDDCVLNSTTVSTNGWSHFECTFTPGANSGTPYIYIEQSDPTAREFWIDAVQLVQASSAGAYFDGKIDASALVFQNQLTVHTADRNSTTAFRVLNASNVPVFTVDTTNNIAKVGGALEVANDVNITGNGVFRINGTLICDINGCAPASTSNSFLQNQSSSLQSANFKIDGTGEMDMAKVNTIQASVYDTIDGSDTISIGTGPNADTIELGGSTYFTSGSSRTLGIWDASEGNDGDDLLVRAGSGNGTDTDGGELILRSGRATGNGTDGNVAVEVGATGAFRVMSDAGDLLNIDAASSSGSILGINSGDLGDWAENDNALLSSRYGAASVAANGYVYVIGGQGPSGATDTVYYAKMYGDGSVGTWSTTTNLPAARNRHSAIVSNGYIYVVGGVTTGTNAQSTIYYAKMNSDGTLSAWNTTTPIGGGSPVNRYKTQVVTFNGYIYVIGGNDGTNAQTSVHYAKIGTEGRIGTWFVDSDTLPAARSWGTAAVANGYVYLMGGEDTNGNPSDTVYYAKISANGGDIGAWQTTSALPSPRIEAISGVTNGHVYVIGGDSTGADSAGYQDTVYYAKVNGSGVLGAWQTDTGDPLPAPRASAATVTVNGYIYSFGGYAGGGSSTGTTEVYYASTSRLQVGASLDLVGLQGQGLSDDGSTNSLGGSITAGDGMFVGGLQVMGQARFTGLVSINLDLQVNGGVVNGGFDFKLGTTDQTTRGDTGLSRAFVKDNGGVLTINYGNDFFGGTKVASPLSANYANNSETAFTVIGSGAVPRFVVDTTNSRVYIGNPTADSVGALLVLDSKDGTDPTGINGGMYYNSDTDKFRCYQGNVWKDCDSWTRLIKSTDTARTSTTTLAADPTIQFSMKANTGYEIRCHIFFSAPDTPDFKFATAGPSGPNGIRTERQLLAPGATAYTAAVDTSATSSTSVVTSGGQGALTLHTQWYTGATADTWAFQWAQNTSSGTATTVLRGSYCEYSTIPSS